MTTSASSTTTPPWHLKIASPCSADWNQMTGDDRVRFCQSCQKNVYNISVMTQGEARRLMEETEDGACVRFYQRDDGTVLTSDCPVGNKLVRKPFQWMLSGGLLFLAPLLTFASVMGASRVKDHAARRQGAAPTTFAQWRQYQPVKFIADWVDPPPPPPATTTVYLGSTS